MDWYYIVGITASVLGVVYAIIKKAKYRALVTDVKSVVEFLQLKLVDGKLTGKEVVDIVKEIIKKF